MSNYYVAGIPFDSDNALSHWGILGMKWGVRRYQNKDGSLTEEGRKRYGSSSEQKKLAKSLTSKNGGSASGYNRQMLNRSAISSTPQVKYAVKQVKDLAKKQNAAQKEFEEALDRDFYRSSAYDEWVDKAVDKYMSKYGQELSDSLFYDTLPSRFKTMEPRELVKYMYKHDDWDQGDCGSLEMFLESKDPRNQNILNAQRASYEADREMAKATKALVKEFLGDYSEERVKGDYGKGRTAGTRLSQIISDDARYSNYESNIDRLANPKRRY